MKLNSTFLLTACVLLAATVTIVAFGIILFKNEDVIEPITMGSPTSTTFRGCDKSPRNLSDSGLRNKFASSSSQVIESLPEYERNNLTEIIQSTQFSPTSVRYSGFVRTVVNCYNQHFNLIVRPDDIWASIMTQFSYYVNKNAEKLRRKLVNFEEKRELIVKSAGSLHTVSYDNLINALTKQIDENLVKNWVLPDFSTTTENDRVAVGVVFMATMKKYFSYEITLGCGIPYITLEGTVQDWKDILGRLEKLKEYELQTWYELLHPIITKFVEAKEGKVYKTFWNSIVDEDGGSGWREISGWITAFGVFDREGNWLGRSGRSSGIVPMDVAAGNVAPHRYC